MIRHLDSDIFESDAQVLVNPVNCVGVSGKGLARQFRDRFPHAQQQYERVCSRGDLQPGKVLLTLRDVDTLDEWDQWIAYFPTKTHWRYPSQIDYILDGLVHLRYQLVAGRFESVAVPALGCGHGGLQWPPVRDAISAVLSGGDLTDVDVQVFPPRWRTNGPHDP